MSKFEKMFPIVEGKEFLDVPLTADELAAMATVFQFCDNAMTQLIQAATENNQPELLDKYKTLQTLSKHFYNKVVTISTLGDDADKLTKH